MTIKPLLIALCVALGASQGNAAVLIGNPPVETWVLSVEVCHDWPPEVLDAVKRGLVRAGPQCRWFPVTTMDRTQIRVFDSEADCDDHVMETPRETFFIRGRRCQMLD